jgi:pantetheine-phosphate adenylyltransferase
LNQAFYPGSFDPITCGHLNIIERAVGIFSRITVLVAVNPRKAPLFSVDETMDMIRQATRQWPQIQVDSTNGLVVDYARKSGIYVAIRGLRAVTDFEGEFAMALTNRSMEPAFETTFLMTDSDYMYLSSTLVRQIAEQGGDVGKFVPPNVERRLKEKFGYV